MQFTQAELDTLLRETRPLDLAGKDLSEADLHEADLRGANLGGADLTQVNLFRANLSDANLIGANLTRTNLRQANLTRTDLRAVDLKQTLDLREVNLSGVNLAQVDLARANLCGVNLSGANLLMANLERADLRAGADLNRSNLNGTNLSGASLVGTNLTSANLINAGLSGADLSGANLKEADLTDADMSQANLREANLAGANLTGTDLTGADLSSADLRGATLRKTELRESNLSHANLTGVDLTELRSLDSPGGGLPAWEGGRMSGVNLSQAKLTTEQRRYAWKHRANFDTMIEADWFLCPRAESLLVFLGDRLSRRKQVLLACGSFRLNFETDKHNNRPEFNQLRLQVVEMAERFMDGKATAAELDIPRAAVERVLAEDPYPNDLMHNTLPDEGGSALNLLGLACGEINSLLDIPGGSMPYVRPFPFYSGEDHLIRDVVGNPFQPAFVVDPGWLLWKDGTVHKLAQSIYEERAFDRMPILADALEEAGCTDWAVLDHCRGEGPHIRGCFVIDAVLGKS
jgi:uncharacterized protein YjbI with pentapeptide repeats